MVALNHDHSSHERTGPNWGLLAALGVNAVLWSAIGLAVSRLL